MTIWTIFGLSTHSIGEKPEIVGKLLSNDEEWRNWNLNSAYLQTTCFCQLLDVDGWGFLLEAICLLKRAMTSLSKIFKIKDKCFLSSLVLRSDRSDIHLSLPADLLLMFYSVKSQCKFGKSRVPRSFDVNSFEKYSTNFWKANSSLI